ncbi:MAG: prephenate dehydrogenase [Lachnospiraceae bacterium]|nr:prephenate dehydrogenase [Lachnospiraceae bacterium]MBQ9122058.1 prephenate dehydrogenase [Lachnospiraceae bacterium]
MHVLKCGFVGLGLIGGSIAKALKNSSSFRAFHTVFDPNIDSLEMAHKDGIADAIVTNLNSDSIQAFGDCDYLFLCAPVQNNIENLTRLKAVLSPNCIITDVGSVKTGIHDAISQLGLSAQFIGGHPMAGSERMGYPNSKALLLENAYYILTPTEDVSSDKISAYQNLVKIMGAIPLVLTHKSHDYATAAISHLPHIIAAALVNLVKDSDSPDGLMKMIAAGGFKDITRIASSSPEMWQQICMTNTSNIASLLGDYIHALDQIYELLLSQDSSKLYDFFDSARSYREGFVGSARGPIKSEYTLNIDISDEPGALASIATMLAVRDISIKNIGITHNREYEEGALRIEFYSPEDVEHAKSLLESKGYNVYIKKDY